MPDRELSLEASQGLPVRKPKKPLETPETEQPREAVVVTAPAQQDKPKPEPRKPGATTTVHDPDTGKTWTFILPDAEKYTRILGRRFATLGTPSLSYTPRWSALLLECVSPKPDLNKISNPEKEWLVRQLRIFIGNEPRVCESNLAEALQKQTKPHEVIEFRSPFTGVQYALFIPTAAELDQYLPKVEDILDDETGNVKIELSVYDNALSQYLDPRLTPEYMKQITPTELEFLEWAAYFFLRLRK